MLVVVTPWWNHHELMPAYMEVADDTADVVFVVVDNASSPPLQFAHPRIITVPREENVGFSRACNDGFMIAAGLTLPPVDADGETRLASAVLFLNNDIEIRGTDVLAGIKTEVRPGRLVGAELSAAKHADIDGVRMPYLDGWCVAGMVDDLSALDDGHGVWDERYLEPSYYGDNDLSVRARAGGFELSEVNVGLRHLGNVTSRAFNVDAVAEKNRARYVARARELLELPTTIGG